MANKNLRLSFDTWQALRRLKFSINASSYSEVIDKLIKSYKGKKVMVNFKIPDDDGSARDVKTDKTVVVSKDMHDKLQDLKNNYVLDHGLPSRGPTAISIGDIIMYMVTEFNEKNK